MNMNNKGLDYYVPKRWVVFLFVYYLLMILVGVIFIQYVLICKIREGSSQETIRMYTFFVSLLSSVMLTGVRYSQKLYKACIDGRVSFESSNKSVFIGNVMYFLLRPVYAVAFAIVFVVCLLGGLSFIMGGMDCSFNERMVYLSSIVSGFIGFSIGNVLDSFETVSKDKINKMLEL